ncbi:MAG: hypothetical protein MIO90_00820 [Methanomassiliicoccales archaeon]|nr:hypothetical protein [Methanomassiliicoccales archaeon]
MSYRFLPLLSLLVVAMMAGLVVAHAPQFVEDNDSIETAMEIEDTVKSWAIYSHLHEGDPRYYTFEMNEGDRLLLDLIVPVKDGDAGFLPRMVLMAQGIPNEGALPGMVEVPEGYGYQVIETMLPDESTYESFTPSAFFDLGRTDSPAPVTGRYYVAVFSTPPEEGNFALIVGYAETFTAQEFVLIPFSLYTIYLWEGQEDWQILAPMAITLVGGLIAYVFYRGRRSAKFDIHHTTLFIGGLLILGTAASTLTQTAISVLDSDLGLSVLLSVFLVLVPATLGSLIIRSAWDVAQPTRASRAKLALFGLISMVAWAGYLIGPVLVIIAALLPKGRLAGPDAGSEPTDGVQDQ